VSESNEKSTWKWLRIPSVVVALLVLYPLSVGPAEWAARKVDASSQGWFGQSVAVGYRPLWAVAQATGADRILLEYVGWCVGEEACTIY
jgi:hypothetical protein